VYDYQWFFFSVLFDDVLSYYVYIASSIDDRMNMKFVGMMLAARTGVCVENLSQLLLVNHKLHTD
jgi:hypothetical protein